MIACKTAYVTGPLKFITVGDIHAWIDRIRTVVNFINSSDADFAVFLGDIGDDTVVGYKYSQIKTELNNLVKPYYILSGNHDTDPVEAPCMEDSDPYVTTFGYLDKIVDNKGYQIIITRYCITNDWSFLFNGTIKEKPTFVFTHGPVKQLVTDCTWVDYFKYNFTMKPELDKLTKLLGVYAGHVHEYNNEMEGITRHVTEEALVSGSVCNTTPTLYVGYTKVNTDLTTQYARLNFNNPFVPPF